MSFIWIALLVFWHLNYDNVPNDRKPSTRNQYMNVLSTQAHINLREREREMVEIYEDNANYLENSTQIKKEVHWLYATNEVDEEEEKEKGI